MSSGKQSAKPKGTERESNDSGGVRSVDRAIKVLEILAREGSAGVSDVATEIGVHKSTAFRLLAALEERDLVEQNSERGKYQLAFGILRLANAIPMRIDLGRQAQPALDELAQRLNETVNLAVTRNHYAIHVQQAFGSAAVASQNWTGRLTPLHATASGKILLAHMSEEQCNATLDATGMRAYTEHTVTSRTVLFEELTRAREEHIATAYEELEIGLNAVAAPVLDHTGTVVGAVSVSGPAYRLDRAKIEQAVEDLRAAVTRISQRMGWLSQAS